MRATAPLTLNERRGAYDEPRRVYEWQERHKEGKKRGLEVLKTHERGAPYATEAEIDLVQINHRKEKRARAVDPARDVRIIQKKPRVTPITPEYQDAAEEIRADYFQWMPAELAVDLTRFRDNAPHHWSVYGQKRETVQLPVREVGTRVDREVDLEAEAAPVKVGRRDLGEHDPRPKRAKK